MSWSSLQPKQRAQACPQGTKGNSSPAVVRTRALDQRRWRWSDDHVWDGRSYKRLSMFRFTSFFEQHYPGAGWAWARRAALAFRRDVGCFGWSMVWLSHKLGLWPPAASPRSCCAEFFPSIGFTEAEMNLMRGLRSNWRGTLHFHCARTSGSRQYMNEFDRFQ